MIEAVVVGRVGVDFTPSIPGASIAEASSFVRAVGGFAGNISTGLARLGLGTAVISSVGDDGHGEHVRAFLAGEGIDVGSISTRPGSRTQVAFFEAHPPDRFPVTFYRLAPAPDTLLAPGDLPARLLEQAPVAVVSGALLAAEPSRSTTLRLLADRGASREARGRSWTIFDLDWRPALWSEPALASGLVRRAAALSDVLIGSDEEFAACELDPTAALDLGPTLVVLKHGSAGVSALGREDRQFRAGIPVEVVCGLGSGDALCAAFTAGILRGLDVPAALERANAAGAIVASRLMCSTAMPTSGEIDRLLATVSAGPREA